MLPVTCSFGWYESLTDSRKQQQVIYDKLPKTTFQIEIYKDFYGKRFVS